MRLPPLNALRAFEAAARHQSVQKAAQELFVTPAAVSQQVKQLEERLGVELFRRLRQTDPAVPVVLLTAWTSLETAVQLVKEGATVQVVMTEAAAIDVFEPELHAGPHVGRRVVEHVGRAVDQVRPFAGERCGKGSLAKDAHLATAEQDSREGLRERTEEGHLKAGRTPPSQQHSTHSTASDPGPRSGGAASASLVLSALCSAPGFSVYFVLSTDTVTPLGTSTGRLPIRDMVTSNANLSSSIFFVATSFTS